MKEFFKSFAHFSSRERKGISILLLLILLVIGFNASLRFWVKPKDNKVDANLETAIKAYIATHSIPNDENNFIAEKEAIPTGELFPFDPNTIDSAGLIRLGLRPITTHMLLNWRRKGKVFYKKEDLKTLYTLKAAEFERLAPYILIQTTNQDKYTDNFYVKQPPLPEHLDLNTIDSNTLVRLPGIGPYISHKIIEKRKALGGFVKIEQLKEVFHFSDTVYHVLKNKFIISTKMVRKFKLNSASISELETHPYISEKMAKNIIMYREGLKGFTNIEQLKQVPLMNEEIYRKIAPYFVIE